MSGSATAPTLTAFTKGDIVISVYGDGDGSGAYADNQASPIVLEEIDPTTGQEVGQMTLPETTTVVNGTTESAISGEYGSSSEGSLELSGDGKSLVIAGYGVNDVTYNNAETNPNAAPGSAGNIYGNAALAQSTSIENGPYLTGATPVARVIADIGYNGTVDTSTALYNVFDGNNPRSVATVDGSSFYIAGQGQSGDTTQGVFYATDGAGSASVIDDSTDARTVEIFQGKVYVSRDSKQSTKASGNSYTSNISTYGGEPTAATTPAILPGISQTVTLTAATENSVNASAVGTPVDLSPENYFFANATTLYIADGGNPKGNTSKHPSLGDGGLQKWTFNGSTWTLQYTLSAGLNLVPDTAAAGTTGLIGLTGVVNADGTVTLYATNSTLTDTGQTYLYTITDTLSATTAAAGESFKVLVTAAADTNIRGIAFAPQCFYPGTGIGTPGGTTAVEALRPGDIVLTANGPLPVRWIGESHVSTRFADPLRVLPIRIRAGALGAGLPLRDLLLSPDHAVFLDGILAQAGALVNGVTILREYAVPEQFTYYHVELASHELLYAEGAPAESFIDNVDRAHFQNWAERATPATPIAELPYPRAKSARQLPRHLRPGLAA